ncbi:unnamed protein product, partial [Cuscuta campestris]
NKEFARALCSPFWIRNMEALSRLSRAEKVLTDYVFNKSLLLGEVLYKDMFCEMKRSDLISFSEGFDKDDVYIVCFNMKKEKITIIDSNGDKTKVYDTCVECLKKGMCEFFNEKQLEQRA